MATTEQPSAYIGQPLVRKEDPELITGRSRYVDDITVPGMLWAYVVRSPFAHARINGVDVSKALAMDGCVAAFSGNDLASEWAAPLVCAWPVTDDIKMSEHWPLAKDKARHVGDGVAVVVATSRALAKDAAELVEVNWEPLPAVTDPLKAMEDGAPLVHDDFGTNVSSVWGFEKGDSPAPHKTSKPFFDDPDLVKVKMRHRLRRLIPNAMEPRGVVVDAERRHGRVHDVHGEPDPAHRAHDPGDHLRHRRGEAARRGPGRGRRLRIEARDLRRGVDLPGPRAAAEHADQVDRGALGGLPRHDPRPRPLHRHGDGGDEGRRAEGRPGQRLVLRRRLPPDRDAGHPDAVGLALRRALRHRGRTTSSTRTSSRTPRRPTRTAAPGRPEATYAVERTLDHLARELGMDPAEIRRKNYIPTEKLPQLHDRGRPHGRLGRLPADARRDDRRPSATTTCAASRRSARRSGDTKQIGIGLSTWTEMCGLAPSRVLHALKYVAGGWDAATIEMLPTGTVRVLIGVTPHGQGHVTTFSQIVADQLGVDVEDIEVLHGDTQVVPLGMDTYGSRSLAVGGVAMHYAGEKVLAKARTLAAHQLECSEDDLEFAGGELHRQGHGPVGQHQGARVRGLDGPRPARRHGARPHRHAPLRPAELLVAERRPRVRGRRSTPRRAAWTSSSTSPWTTAASSSTRSSSRARSTAASRRASRRPCSRRRPTTRRATSCTGR